ncbi:MAG TPA: hypothetical protein VF522_05595 [Ramlibacter sp.]|uniref:hypothetical protein n=1 Tax=Ramlibacter sp. TaxID=1917967 RepID=UPI002ED5AEBD
MPYSRSRTRSVSSALGRGLAALAIAAVLFPQAPAVAGQLPLRSAKLADLRGEQASADVRHVADWAVDSGDPGGLPFVIVDKRDSRVFVFDAEGRLRGSSPALVGAARGDESVPGIGSREIASIRPEERTTPAGRFTAVMGQGPRGEDILWVDYDSALALHRVVTSVPQERRLQRLQSKVSAERRITYGCINVPVSFYDAVVRSTFSGSGGIVYILPESRRPQDLFGSYEVRQPAGHATAWQAHPAH